MKIYTQIKKSNKDTIQDFIIKFYSTDYNTPTTYSNKSCTTIECDNGRNRSLDALFYICKTKFSNLTELRFCKEIKKFMHNSKKGEKFAMLFCTHINGWVVYSIGGAIVVYNNPLVYNFEDSKNKLELKGSNNLCANDVILA